MARHDVLARHEARKAYDKEQSDGEYAKDRNKLPLEERSHARVAYWLNPLGTGRYPTAPGTEWS